MNPVMQFRAHVSHDHGTTPFTTWASSKKQVKEVIMAAQHCPERAIKLVEAVDLKKRYKEILQTQIKEAKVLLEEAAAIQKILAPFDGQPAKILEKKLPGEMTLTADADYIIIEILYTRHRHFIALRKDPKINLQKFEIINGCNTIGPRDTITKAEALLKNTPKITKQAKLISELNSLCDKILNVCNEMNYEGLTTQHPAYNALMKLHSLPLNLIRDIMQP